MTVTIKDGASVLGTTVANGAGAWSFTTGCLARARMPYGDGDGQGGQHRPPRLRWR